MPVDPNSSYDIVDPALTISVREVKWATVVGELRAREVLG